WEPATLAVMRRVAELRNAGVEAYFSIDAGPQVKVLCEQESAATVRAALAAVPGVLRVLVSAPGDGARSIDELPAWARESARPIRGRRYSLRRSRSDAASSRSKGRWR